MNNQVKKPLNHNTTLCIILSYIFISHAALAVLPGPLKLNGINWALGKPARQISDWHPGSVAHNAVNNRAPRTSAKTKGAIQPWWEVDLEAVRYIEYINVWAKEGSESNLSNFYVLISENPFVSGNLDNVLAQPGVTAIFTAGAAGFPTKVPADVEGRYVRVQLSNESHSRLILSEVEVIATPVGFQGKSVAQSSTANGYAAGRALDGNTSGVWNSGSVTSTANEFQPWWEVDLGEAGYIFGLNTELLQN